MNGSPLFAGAPGGGESEIRRWIIENDWLDVVVGLPNDLFYNTGISTFVWVITNNKAPERRGKVQLIDARDLFTKLPKSLGNKRNTLTDAHIAEVVSLYGDAAEGGRARWMTNAELGFQRVPISRPKRARVRGGGEALEQLRQHPAWIQLTVRKGTTDLMAVRDAIEKAVDALPEEGLTVESALAELAKDPAWSDLLKKSKAAVVDAIMVDDPQADAVQDANGKLVADPDLRGSITVPLGADIAEHVEREVLPHAQDAWAETSKVKVGYEIPFAETFFAYQPPRPLSEIDAELRLVEDEVLRLLQRVTD